MAKGSKLVGNKMPGGNGQSTKGRVPSTSGAVTPDNPRQESKINAIDALGHTTGRIPDLRGHVPTGSGGNAPLMPPAPPAGGGMV